VCHFCHAQPFEITHGENIKSPLVQPSCQDAKVVQAFCHAGYRLSTPCLVRQPTVDAFRVPDEMPTARNSRASRWRHAFHRGRRQHAILIAPAAALVHFGHRPIRREDRLVIAGIRNASQNVCGRQSRGFLQTRCSPASRERWARTRTAQSRLPNPRRFGSRPEARSGAEPCASQ
jgi:hypothetical protein